MPPGSCLGGIQHDLIGQGRSYSSRRWYSDISFKIHGFPPSYSFQPGDFILNPVEAEWISAEFFGSFHELEDILEGRLPH
jgi:hypothetical protein